MNSTIKKVGLSFNNIQDTGTKVLADAFKVNSTITEVKLQANNIGDIGSSLLRKALKLNSSIRNLNLYNNHIRDIGTRSLVEVFKLNATIQALSWDGDTILSLNVEQQLNINTVLEKIGRYFLTFKYLLYQLSPHPSVIITANEENEEIFRDKKKRKVCQQEKEKVSQEGSDRDKINSRRRKQNQRSVLPVEFVKMLSDYLTWEDLSMKNAVPMIINNPHLFRSCSLNSGMTDFEYFCFRTDEKQKEIDLDNPKKMGYEKLKRIILS